MTYTAAPDILPFIFTSPVPSNPDTSIIRQTLESIAERLPFAPRVILADGVRPEQQDRAANYTKFLENVSQLDVFDIAFEEMPFLHQSGLLRKNIRSVTSEFILFMEHDTPLTGDIPWFSICNAMNDCDLNIVRFMHETHVLEEHEYLFGDMVEDLALRRTIQFSARPHLAKTSFYKDVMERFFDDGSRCFIEDRLYGQAQVEDFKMAVYLPQGNAQRSLHLDGRAGDPKYKQTFQNGRLKP